jgi:glycosyltransferase involved in cell wall biosynthesis
VTAAPIASARLVVGLPVYNERRYIQATLEALAAQDHADFKVLVSDNGSTDGSAEVCRAFAETDARFVFVRHPMNMGSARNFAYCREASSSEYFMWCGAHDSLSPNFLSRMSSVLDRDPGVALAFGSRLAMDEGSVPIDALNDGRHVYRFSRNRFLRYAQAACALSECTVVYGLFRRRCLDGFSIEPVRSCDKVMLCHLLFRGRLQYDPGATYARRFFGSRASTHGERILGNDSESGMEFEHLVGYFATDLAQCRAYRGPGALPWPERIIMKVIRARFMSRADAWLRFLARLQVQPRRTCRALVRLALGRDA